MDKNEISDKINNIDIFYMMDNQSAMINPNDPDYHIELFWYGFKTSMYNFYNAYRMSYCHIQKWSDNLNELKKNKRYDNIERDIRDYMAHYSFDLTKHSNSNYYDQILISNIKRWDKISNTYKFKSCQKYNKIILLFYIYNEIKQDSDIINFHEQIKDIDYTISTNDYDSIIYYAVVMNKSKILEKLRLIPGYNAVENIKRLYPGLNIQDPNIKMNKLCLLIKRYSI
jgi:hypothetical protein